MILFLFSVSSNSFNWIRICYSHEYVGTEDDRAVFKAQVRRARLFSCIWLNVCDAPLASRICHAFTPAVMTHVIDPVCRCHWRFMTPSGHRWTLAERGIPVARSKAWMISRRKLVRSSRWLSRNSVHHASFGGIYLNHEGCLDIVIVSDLQWRTDCFGRIKLRKKVKAEKLLSAKEAWMDPTSSKVLWPSEILNQVLQ